jgi:YbbR domain-containing protein
MMKWIKENDVILRVTSLLIAVLLWAYAMSNDQSDVKQSFRDLPIQLEGVNILKDQDLVIMSGANGTVDVELVGKREQVSTAMSDPLTTIKRVVSVANITEPGTYELGIQAEPVGLDGTSVSAKQPATVTIVVDRMSSTSVPVEVELTGQLGAGLELAEYRMIRDKAMRNQTIIQGDGAN